MAIAEKAPNFQRLAADIYMLDPDTQPRSSTGTGSTSRTRNLATPPSTIIVLAWMGAHLRHVSKYTAKYSQVYPDARIILITPNWGDFIYRPARAQLRRLAPAVAALLAAKDDGKVLVHLFSNGGAGQLSTLAAAFRDETGKLLPMQALVLDSAPGRATFLQSILVILLTLPRQWYLRPLLFVLTVLLVGTLWLVKALTGARDVIERLREDLNDSQLIVRGAPRCYIYSDSDESVAAKDIEDHADEARRKGWLVSTEKFVGSPHVGHMRLDGARYWKIVEDLWERSCKDGQE